MTTFTTEDRIAVEKTGEDMSTRNFGMVGKAYRNASEAFKDADYATAIERPIKSDFSGIGAFIAALIFLGLFAYGFWLTIGR